MAESLILPGFAPSQKDRKHDGLRPYQRAAVDAWKRDLRDVRGALGVMFTGGGKTRTATTWIRETHGNVLWLAMRDFLIDQASETIRELTGEWVSVEKASQTMSGTRIVMGSVQTMKGKRLERISKDRFDFIVFDEAHHAVAPGPLAIFDHFGIAKIVGLTATPFRLDKIGLNNAFQKTSFEYDIRWGIDEGYFCPVKAVRRDIDQIDLTGVKSTLGDLQIGALEEEIIKNSAPIARIAYEESEQGKLPFIVYTPGVASARAVAETLKELAKDSEFATFVDQETPKWRRRQILGAFGSKLRGIANCQIYTEGLDVPLARCIVIARMTESLSLYQQMAGRGGRTEPGSSEYLLKEDRISAIAKSGKPWFKLVDITGKAGRHSLITSVDALAGKEATQEIKDIAKEIIKQSSGIELDEAIKKGAEEKYKREKEELERAKKRIAEISATIDISAQRSEFDAFTESEEDIGGMEPEWFQQQPTPQQLHWLRENKLPETTSRGECAAMQKQAKQWRRLGMASYKQRHILKRAKLPEDVPFPVASRLIDALAKNGWIPNKAKYLTDKILSEGREPGEDG